MTLAIEHHDGQLVDVALKGFGHLVQVFFDRSVEAHEVGGGGADHDLVHVNVGRVEQAALFRGGDGGDRVRRSGGAKVRSFERIDGDVDLGVDLAFRPAAAERLADVEHGSL